MERYQENPEEYLPEAALLAQANGYLEDYE